MEGAEWSGRATWLTSQHESHTLATALAEGTQEQAPVLLLDVSIGFKHDDSAGRASGRRRKHRGSLRRQELVLSTTVGVKTVTRYYVLTVIHVTSI